MIQKEPYEIIQKIRLPKCYSLELNEVVSQIFLKNINDRSNSSKIINSQYFVDLKNKIIFERCYIVDPYLVCLYEFENFEIDICLKHIDASINFFVSDKNIFYLSKFILLKMKVLLFTNLLNELSTFIQQKLFKDLFPILEELLKNDEFFITFYCLKVQWDFLSYNENIAKDISILNEKVRTSNLRLENDTQYTYYLSLGIILSKNEIS